MVIIGYNRHIKKGMNKMNNENNLEELLRMKGKTINNAAKEMGLRQGTLVNMLKRGIENANIKTIITLSNYLNISIDELLNHQNKITEENMKINEINKKLNLLNKKELNSIDKIIEEIINIKENR